MKKILIALLFTSCFFNYTSVNATEHHGGHGGGKKPSGNACVRPRLEKFLPPNMATVAPGGDISFVAFNIEKPEHIMVTAKKQPVTLKTEFKDPFYIVTGKLPDGLRNTIARIDVMVHGKCEAETGWLVKITE